MHSEQIDTNLGTVKFDASNGQASYCDSVDQASDDAEAVSNDADSLSDDADSQTNDITTQQDVSSAENDLASLKCDGLPGLGGLRDRSRAPTETSAAHEEPEADS